MDSTRLSSTGTSPRLQVLGNPAEAQGCSTSSKQPATLPGAQWSGPHGRASPSGVAPRNGNPGKSRFESFASPSSRDDTVGTDAKFDQKFRIADLRHNRVAREWDALGSKAEQIPSTNLHVHFGGSIPAETVARFTPYTGTLEETLGRISKKLFYVPDANKGLLPFLDHYTPTSREIPLPDPKFAKEVAKDIAYSETEIP